MIQPLNISTFQHCLDIRLSLRKADNFAGFLPLTALLKQFDALEPLQDISLSRDSAGAFQAAMLRHKNPFREIGAGTLRQDR